MQLRPVDRVHVEYREHRLQELRGELATHTIGVVLSALLAASLVSGFDFTLSGEKKALFIQTRD